MNKFIQSTKQFFNKKPVRIVTAIVIIAIIMTGVAFGVIALVNAFSDPCTKQPGTTWDKDLKVCVKDGCKNICGTDTGPFKKGNCMQDDYCNYTQQGIKYKFDPDSCQCIGICSNDEEIAKTDNGFDSTVMSKTESGWEPVNPLRCGSECEFSKSGICTDLEAKCSVSIDNKGNLIGPKTGCIVGTEYNKCKTDSRISCRTSKNKHDINYSCEEVLQDKEDISFNINGNTYTTRTYCKNLDKCGEKSYSDYEQVCQSDADCGTGSCSKLTNDIFNKKGIYNIGVCTNTSDFLGPKENDKCVKPNNVGERKKTGDTNENLIYINNNSGYEGISLNQPQCQDIVGTTPICKNGKVENWFCKGDYIDKCTYSSDQEPNISCPETPPIKIGQEGKKYNFDVNCCSSNKISKLGNYGTFCCPQEVQQSGLYAYKCLNFSEHPPDKSWLEINPQIKTTCNLDKDCLVFEKPLFSKLQGGAQNTSSNEETYSGVFCDKSSVSSSKSGTGQCKFFAGYIDKPEGHDVKYASKWIMGNDSSTSEAILKQPKYDGWEFPVLTLNNGSDFNMCTKEKNIYSKDNKFRDIQDGYNAYLSVSKNKKTKLPTKLECLKYAKHTGNDSFYTSFVQEDGSINTSSNIEINSNNCTIVADCNSPSFGTTINNAQGDTDLLNFDFKPNDIDKLSIPEGQTLVSKNNNKNIYFAAKPKITKPYEKDCGTMDIDNCEKIDIPNEWSNYKHLFKNVCKKTGSQSCNVDDSLQAKYILDNGVYCPKGVQLYKGDLVCNY